MSDKELFEKYAEICDHRQRRLMDVQETAMFCALRDMLKKGAKLAELVNGPTQSTISHDDWYALRNERDRLTARLIEAERLLRRAANAAKDNVQGDMVVDEIRAFLRPTVSACEHVRINDAWSAENGRCVKCGDTDSAEGGAK